MYKSANRAQNLRFTYFGDGFGVEPRDFGEGNPKPWEMTLRVQSFGKSAAASRTVTNPRWTVDRNTADLAADGIAIDYKNDENGLRQNFWVLRRPDGPEPLHVILEVGSEELSFAVDTEQNVVSFYAAASPAPEEEVLRYWDLHVWDATERKLDAAMVQVDENRFAIVVDDANAVYPILVDPLTSKKAWTESQSGARFGFVVAPYGQVSGTGGPGVLVGAPYFDTGSYVNAGKAFYFSGASSSLPDTPTWTKEGDQAYAYFGWSIADAYNVYGDEYAEVIVGAPYYDSGAYTDNGKVYVFAGTASGFGTSPVWTFTQDQSYAHAGWSVTGIKDVNVDGYDEMAVGVPDADYSGSADVGFVHVFKGGSNGPTSWNSIITGPAYSQLGFSLAWGFNLNNDTVPDLIVGAPGMSTGGSAPGAVKVYYGSSASGFGGSSTTLWGQNSGEKFGFSVACPGDVDEGWYYQDVLVGAPHHSNGQTLEGKAYLFTGGSSGVNTSPFFTVESNQAYARLGYSVGGFPSIAGWGGDMNFDGYKDFIVGAPYYDTTSLSLTDNGEAWFYLGGSTPSKSTVVAGIKSYDHNGWSVALGRVANHIGVGVLVGAPDAHDSSGNLTGGTVTVWGWSN